MKVLILGIDALEYTLVEKWDLKYLKQKEYGKVTVPINKSVGEPSTLEVWTSFITGKLPGEYGYEGLMVYKQPIKWFMEHRNPKHKQHNNIIETRNKKRKVLDLASLSLMKLKLGERPSRKHITVSTIFDNPKSFAHHIPIYCDDAFPEYRKHTATDALENESFKPIYEKGCKKEFDERTNEVRTFLNDDSWNLCLEYFFLLDGIQHVFFKNKTTILNWYLKFNEFVGEISKKIPNDVMLLVVSDHGQINGLHTPYAFYSSNIKLNQKPKSITDFKGIIEAKLNGST